MKNKQLIIKSLNITELAYCNMVMDCGMHYLLVWISDRRLAEEASKVKEFWAWWKNQWAITDQHFVRISNIALINEKLEGNVRQAAIELYNEMHNPNYLKAKPNVWVRIEINKILINELGIEELKIKQKAN